MEQPSEWIDGKYLVVTDMTALPRRCVRTNRQVSEAEYRTMTLPWLPEWLRVAMCLMPFFLLFAPYAAKRCRLQVGISKQVRNQYLMRKLFAGVMIVGALLLPLLCVAIEQYRAAAAVSLLMPFLFWGGFILLILFSSPLVIQDQKGEHFWLAGCSPEFLDGVGDLLEEREAAGTS